MLSSHTTTLATPAYMHSFPQETTSGYLVSISCRCNLRCNSTHVGDAVTVSTKSVGKGRFAVSSARIHRATRSSARPCIGPLKGSSSRMVCGPSTSGPLDNPGCPDGKHSSIVFHMCTNAQRCSPVAHCSFARSYARLGDCCVLASIASTRRARAKFVFLRATRAVVTMICSSCCAGIHLR